MWRRKRDQHVDDASREIDDAKGRLERAQRSLEQARSDDGKVEYVTRKVLELRRRDRFGPTIGAALRGQH